MSRVIVAGKVYRQVAEREVKELCVFDFDNTLFKSPDKPDWWPHRAWWSNEESLLPPCVPEEPSASWWNSEVVAEAKESISDDTVYTVMITGRLKDKFADRVTDLLKQKDLLFDELRFKHSPKEKTDTYKARHIRSITKKFPEGLERVQIWDDQKDNLDTVKEYLEERDVKTLTHYVEPEAKDVECSEKKYEEYEEG